MLFAACGRLRFDAVTTSDGNVDDADGVAIDAPPPCKGPFAAPRELAELRVAGSASEEGATMTDDRLEIYFGADRPGALGGEAIYHATRATTADLFDAGERVVAFDSMGIDDDPYLESDQLTMWMFWDATLVRSVRADRNSPWSVPAPVAEFPTGNGDGAVSMSSDGLTMYFSSGRLPTSGNGDVWRAERASLAAPFTTFVHEAIASSNSFDCCPEVLAGDTQVAFSSQRLGLTHLYVSDRAGDGTLGPSTLMSMVNSVDPYVDYDLFATRDGVAVGVTSTRPGTVGGSAAIWLYERTCP
ncbi:hypothetical protein BH11MYX2_BH11MYX2_21580 [soil metagenome]